MEACPICFQAFAVGDELIAHCSTHFSRDDQADDDDEIVILDDDSPPRQREDRQQASSSQKESEKNSSSTKATLHHCIYKCLLSQLPNGSMTYLSASVEHFESGSDDRGWGCGYKNMQMILSALVRSSEVHRAKITTQLGQHLDITCLQKAIENAWAQGFDAPGADQLNHKLQDTRKWVGTSEAAVLFRFSGYTAEIVDFELVGQARNSIQMGPSSSHQGVACDGCGQCPIVGIRYKSLVLPDYDLCQSCKESPTQIGASPFSEISPPGSTQQTGQQDSQVSNRKKQLAKLLLQWVWRYFSEGVKTESPKPTHQQAFCTRKMPLYFQHQGHSRTIVGIKKEEKTSGPVFHLLVLDPSQRTSSLLKACQTQWKWQELLLVGESALNKMAYQVLYVVANLSSNAQSSNRKTLVCKEHITC